MTAADVFELKEPEEANWATSFAMLEFVMTAG